MDVFIEELVAKKTDGRDTALKACIITASASLSLIIISFSIFIGYLPLVIVVGGVIWLASFILKGLKVEYEYILTNRDLDIDKITGARKRKRLVSLNLMNASEFGKYNPDFDSKNDVSVLAHDNSYQNLWYMKIRREELGNVLLLFSPSDEFAIAVNRALPAKAKNSEVSRLSENLD